MRKGMAQKTAEAHQVRLAISAYMLANKLSVNAMAKGSGLTQSTLQRFMCGQTKSVTKSILALLSYAQIEAEECISDFGAMDDARIRQALTKVWDGRSETAELLASLIEALAPVLKRAGR